MRSARARRAGQIAIRIAFAGLFATAGVAAPAAEAPAKAPAKKKAAPKPKPPTTSELQRLLTEQRALIDGQQALITDLQATLALRETRIQGQDAAIEEQRTRLAAMEQQLLAMQQRMDELMAQIPGAEEQQAFEERLRRIEEESQAPPELPSTLVSAGDFPGSIRIPGTDAAIKFGGRIRTAAVFTLGSLGSDDRFLTNSIPVEPEDEAAGKGARTTFSANTSRLNFELRTPTGAGHMRAFLEGDFYGSNEGGSRTNFRLRHAFAQFQGFLVGQTWSTFSDPAADHQDLDFEGINGENVIRQPQIRYTWHLKDDLSVAAAAETPEVSLTGGQGVNLVPDLVGRAVWEFKEIGHLQAAVVLRQIRGESDVSPGDVSAVYGYGATLSGVIPFQYFNLTDRLIFQLNLGKGNARYINDLSSLGGQDAVFDPATGELHALPAVGFYVDYEHEWKEWERTRVMKLRTSIIWSYVTVDNLDFQTSDAYRKTNRLSANLVFSPISRIDLGVEYIYGTRENKGGNRGSSDQFQAVGTFRF